MALVNLNGPLALPAFWMSSTATGTMDATNELVGGVFLCQTGCTVTHIEFATGTVTTGASVRVGLQAVDMATGQPTGTPPVTWLGATGNGYGDQAIADTGDNSTFTVALGESVTLTAGTMYAVLVKWTSDATTGTLQIRRNSDTGITFALGYSASNVNRGLAYGLDPTNSSKLSTTGPMFTLLCNGVCYEQLGLMPVLPAVTASVTLDSDGTIRAAGNRISVPYGARAIGIAYYGDWDENVELHLYDDAGNSLASATADKDVRAATSAVTGVHFFSSPYTIAKDTWYRVAAVATSTTAITSGITKATLQTAAGLGQLPMGTSCSYCFKGSGAWDDTETAARATIALVIDQVAGATDTGGGVVGRFDEVIG